MSNFILEEMNKIKADGIDFVNLLPTVNNFVVYKSVTKEEFEKNRYILKTNRMYWKIIDGEKKYYNYKNGSWVNSDDILNE